MCAVRESIDTLSRIILLTNWSAFISTSISLLPRPIGRIKKCLLMHSSLHTAQQAAAFSYCVCLYSGPAGKKPFVARVEGLWGLVHLHTRLIQFRVVSNPSAEEASIVFSSENTCIMGLQSWMKRQFNRPTSAAGVLKT